MSQSSPPTSDDPTAGPHARLARTHLAFGWAMLLVFLSLGLALEAMHAFKLGLYLDAGQEARRLTWTLAHAHGTLFGLVHVALSVSLPRLGETLSVPAARLASRSLCAGTLGMPLGFLLGGLFAEAGDPGFAVVLAPIGALLILVAVAIVARAAWRARSPR